ncbi:glutaminyl-peptide cyclotransferase [Pedobacter foliorum]|uniref:glutaminyl-peptide cyclotransferase n=1 Tax=Pedobacter foliorum TaxID=2739058 RepID=UPI001563B980|nr:glutaminyl-peptide cyclotransferase [Pedobacter foliorum]NRF38767.1 glutaminyl-peptide cyclotransferase [Pedobacter foliorum]
MHSGQVKNNTNFFKVIPFLSLLFGVSVVISCKNEPTVSIVGFKAPEQGQTFSLGDDVKVELDAPKDNQIKSVTYLVDGKVITTKNGVEPITVKTDGFAVGYKLITAITDDGSQKDTSTINIVLKSALKPEMFSYKIVKTYPHDTSSYTQGLEYHNGRLLESTGENGFSTLRWVDLATGKALQKIDLDKQYFGEGSTLVGDKVVMLTYKANQGFVYDAKTFKQLGTFPYQTSREGWGLCFDGKQLIMSDGSNRLYFMNKDTFKDESAIDVYDNLGAVDSINELEYIDGKIYANIYQQNYLVVINPKTGIVEQKIDLNGLLPKGYFKSEDSILNDVLNGIAWDKQGKRLFVTGKKWPKLFEIALVPVKGN